ncbi:MAG: nicotinate-nucleotide--dimethylbenzimidazole phosphoribosyltransferase [Planctomycetaceae bacterium]|jgi:nicotinate-nucleotide--dimethylbenzimidazole phosphoribosyltransferase|nr:nicotinate-nucleotide--dimethylbenzimidazole phosphoribosyltransferase [Planctomycetaceae bacterium]
MDIEEIITKIQPLDLNAQNLARTRQDSLIKPLGSLGRLEELSVQLAGITGDMTRRFIKKAIVIMCADNGVYEEGVSAAPQSFTLMQTLNFQKGITGVSVLSKLSNSKMVVVDIGVNGNIVSENVVNKKIRKGTNNLAKEPAMTRDEVIQAIIIGFEEVQKLQLMGFSVVGTGEMGLGNTTTSSLILMALTDCSVDDAVGKGAGLSDEDFVHKKEIVQKAFDYHKPDKNDPIGVLEKVGGFDIAGLVGVYLGAAYFRFPVVIDGVISASAALLAFQLCPKIRDFMIPSHGSREPGYNIAIQKLGMKPYFDLEMRLGEGSGCPFTFLLIDAAQMILNQMATFDNTAMDNNKLIDIRKP